MIKKMSNHLSRLVQALQDGEFHDGSALGERLGLTRSAVWKMIKKLERYDIEINSVKGKGYALCEPLILLDEEKIREHLNDKQCQFVLFESIASTNDYLRMLCSQKGVHYCIAEQQTAGKGRLARTWYSPFGKNIYLSCSYPFQKDISELAGLSLVVSLATRSVLSRFGLSENLYVKWPNDIVCDGKKISGTLVEVQAESHGACQAVIGIGINVNMIIDERRNVSQPWTSMRRATGKYLDRNAVAAVLMEALKDYLQRFNAHGFAAFMDEWMDAEGLKNKAIAVKTADEVVSGIAAGINAHGHLLMRLADGTVRAFSSGDTSILKK